MAEMSAEERFKTVVPGLFGLVGTMAKGVDKRFGAAQPVVEAFDSKGSLVDWDVEAKQQGIPDKMILMAPEICYIEIEGTEVAIEKICFFFV